MWSYYANVFELNSNQCTKRRIVLRMEWRGEGAERANYPVAHETQKQLVLG